MPTITDILAAIDALKRGISTDPAGTIKDLGKGAIGGMGDAADMVNSVGGLIRGNPITPPEFGPAVRGLIGSTGTSVENTGGLLPIPGPGTLGTVAKGLLASKEALPLGGLLGQLVFHGTPHKFDKFDLSKIGTGEGAQAYGHGIYFAEAPSVAKTYQGKVSAMQGSGEPTIGGKPINWDDPIQTAAFELSRHDGDRAAAADFFERTFKKSDVPSILRSDKHLPKVDLPGSLYQQTLPDSVLPKMLQWDRPLSEQPANVKAALVPVMQRFGRDPRYVTGQDAIKAVEDIGFIKDQYGGGQKGVTAYLQANGVPGLSYLDGGSRAGGKGTMNHVIWDQDLLDRMTPQAVP